MDRRTYLRQHFENRVAKRIGSENASLPPSLVTALAHQEPYACVDWFMSLDPSRNKRFSQWLIETYLRGGYRLEDAGKAEETLSLFLANQHRMNSQQRDIGSYKILADLWVAVKQFHQVENEDWTLEGKMKRRAEKTKAYEESIILADEEDFTIAVPLTIYASKWWGRGTRWCTAAEKDNAFEGYNKLGPLIVFDLKKEGKFQLFVDDMETQFMNAEDKEVDHAVTSQHWDKMAVIFEWAVQKNGQALQLVPIEHRTLALCSKALNQKGTALKHVPSKLIDYTLCLAAVRNDGYALKEVPFQHLDYNLSLEAVRQAGLALRYVNNLFLDDALCLEALRNNINAWHCVPEEFKERLHNYVETDEVQKLVSIFDDLECDDSLFSDNEPWLDDEMHSFEAIARYFQAKSNTESMQLTY